MKTLHGCVKIETSTITFIDCLVASATSASTTNDCHGFNLDQQLRHDQGGGGNRSAGRYAVWERLSAGLGEIRIGRDIS